MGCQVIFQFQFGGERIAFEVEIVNIFVFYRIYSVLQIVFHDIDLKWEYRCRFFFRYAYSFFLLHQYSSCPNLHLSAHIFLFLILKFNFILISIRILRLRPKKQTEKRTLDSDVGNPR